MKRRESCVVYRAAKSDRSWQSIRESRVWPGPEPNRAALEAAIQSIRPSDEASSFGELTRALRVQAQTTGMQLNVHLFSDMQQTSMPANFKDLTLGPDAKLEIHKVGQIPRRTGPWKV